MLRTLGNILRLAALGLVCFLSAVAQPASVEFAKDILPVLSTRCLGCHSGNNAKGGLKIHTRADLLSGGRSGAAIIPGDAANSLFLRKILGQQGTRMPPSGPALAPEAVDAIRAWIDGGAKYDGVLGTVDRLAPMEPRLPDLPENGIAHPVDRLLQPYFQKNGVTTSTPISDAQFARRVWFDLVGLPPAPDKLDQFLKDSSPNKRESLIAQLLADRKNYAEHWISYWNDLLRNDEGVVYHGERKSITKWLQNALATNRPYDQMVQELLDPSANKDAEGYLTGVTWRGVVSASQTPPMQAAQNSAQVFLGMNLKCAACHDSFVNRWKLADTFGLAALFSHEPLELVRCDIKTGKQAVARFPVKDLGVKFDDTLTSRRSAAATWFTNENNGRFARTIVNRYWKLLLGRGLVEPIDDMDAEPWNRDLLDWLSSDFTANGYDLQRLLSTILSSQAYQMASVPEPATDAPYVFRGPLPRRVTAEQFQDSLSAATGDWRVLTPRNGKSAEYTREWRLKSDPLSRALGRPIRDQVYTERNQESSTLQSLELSNGPLLTHRLERASRALLGKSVVPPQNLFDSAMMRGGSKTVDIDITRATELWLLVQDVDSYDPSRVRTGWVNPTLIAKLSSGNRSRTNSLATNTEIHRKDLPPSPALSTELGALVRIPIDGRAYRRFQADVAVDLRSQPSDIAPSVRFFVFQEKPDLERLVRIEGVSPLPAPPQPKTNDALVSYLYRYLLSRDPSTEERRLALTILTGDPNTASNLAAERVPATEGVEDLLWALLMSPEFQFLQ